MKKTFFSILLLLILCCFVITGCDFETKKDNSSDLKYLLASKSEVKNVDLWEAILEQIKKHEVEFIKVKGHADNEYNNRCDKIAREEYKKYVN